MHAHDQPSRRIDQPQPGFFRMPLVKGGWVVPALIVYQDGLWWAVVDGLQHPPNPDPFAAPWVSRIWEGASFATETDYRWRLATKAWAIKHDPDHPCLDPEKPISRMRLRPIIPQTEDTNT